MADAEGAEASIAVAYMTVCQELGCQPSEEFLQAARSGTRMLKLRSALSESTLFATASLLPYTHFEEIDLSGLKLTAEGWQALLESCSKCGSLQVLSIKGCGIGKLGAAACDQVAKLLAKCPMGVLDVSLNNIDDAFAAALASSGLAASERLVVLDLSENEITCAGASDLARALEAVGSTAALRQLDLGFNRIGNVGAGALASMLPAVPSLAALELESNLVGDMGIAALAQAVKTCTTLQRVNVNFNQITGAGLAAMADALMSNPGSLQELTMAGATGRNSEDALATLLRAAAASACPLQLLDVRGVGLQGAALDALCELLAASHVPLSSLRCDVARRDGAERIAQALPTNTTLINLMLGGPVPEHVLSFIGAVLSANIQAAADASAGGAQPGANTEQQRGSPSAPAAGASQKPLQTGSLRNSLRMSRGSAAAPGSPSPPHAAAAAVPATSPPPQRPPFAVGSSAGGGAAAAGTRSPGASSGGGGAATRRSLSRTLTVQARTAGAMDPSGIPGLSGGGGADKAADVFRRHDVDCSGYLDEHEMVAALGDLGLLEGLTARQLGKFVAKALRESDVDRNGRVTLEEFIDYYHRVARHYNDAARQGRITSRSRVASPPVDAAGDDHLKRVFRAYCKLPIGRGRQVGASVQHLNGVQFREMTRDAGLVEPEGPLSQCAIDIIFTRVKASGHKRLAFKEFLAALAALADEAGWEWSRLRDSLSVATMRDSIVRDTGVGASDGGATASPADSPHSTWRGGANTISGAVPSPLAATSGVPTPGTLKTNPLFDSGRQGSPGRSGGGGGAAAASAGSPGATGVLQDSAKGSAPTASVLASIMSRLESLETAGARRQRQLDSVCVQQAELALELQRLATRLATGSPRGGSGPGAGASMGGSNAAAAMAVQKLAGQLAAVERAVDELRTGGGGDAAARVERKMMERQARVESALMQVARQVDVLDVRLREEQETSLRALEAILAGTAPSPTPKKR